MPTKSQFQSPQAFLRWIPPAQVGHFLASGTNTFRLANAPDAWVEHLGSDLLISYKEGVDLEPILAECREWQPPSGDALSRIWGKLLPKLNADRVTPQLLHGEAGQSPLTTVLEAGVKYGLDFSAGYSAGLFLDQRSNRARVRRVAPKRLLNTFAYTCSFSVVAALVGGETVNVDLSKKSLDRGRENFELNGLSTKKHKFIADSVLDVLPRLARRGEKFDAIVLDPPTFSRSHDGSRFQVERDFERLIADALEVAANGASLLLSTNCTKLRRIALETTARHCLKLTRRTGSFYTEPALPDIPPDQAATTLWLELR